MARRVPRRDAMTKLRQLLVSQYPFAYCDGCLALHLGIGLADAHTAALAVSSEPGFIRQRRLLRVRSRDSSDVDQ
jgi:hypothetical protein